MHNPGSQADIFERTLGMVPCVRRQQHAVVIGTEMLKERYEVAVTAPAIHIMHAALQEACTLRVPLCMGEGWMVAWPGRVAADSVQFAAGVLT